MTGSSCYRVERHAIPNVKQRYAGLPATSEHFDVVINTDADCVDADTGRLVCRLRRGVVSRDAVDAARKAYGDIDELEPPSVSRRGAAGLLDVNAFRVLRGDVADIVRVSPTSGHLKLTTGKVLKQTVSNPVHSYLAGYSFTRFGQRNVVGRLTKRYPEKWAWSQPFFREVDAVLAKELPEIYAKHLRRCSLHPRWRIDQTALSTVTINVNYESRYHCDTGDFRDGYSTLSVVEIGSYRGGLLVFPAYRVAVDVREGDVLLCQSHVDLHGNTAVERNTPLAKRLSFVTYLKHKLAEGSNRTEEPLAETSD